MIPILPANDVSAVRPFLVNRFLSEREKEVERDIEFRDKNDSEREFAPLRCAEDAKLIDSSDLNFDEVCDIIFDMIKEIL